jgi:predicted RNase H-like HicB family nuclease
MLTEYIQAALQRAKYEIFPEDQTYYGEIPGFQGVWANRDTLEACREELREVLEDWLLLRLRSDHALPVVDGISLAVERVMA